MKRPDVCSKQSHRNLSIKAVCFRTVDGDHLVGLLTAETPTSVTLRRPLGQEDTILRKDIVSMYDDSFSLMPHGLEKNMTRQELADLIAYLRGGSTPTHSTTAAWK